jgi:GLPGLI family protein
MKLKPYLTILAALAVTAANAQKADTAQAIIHYKFTHVRDTNNRDKPLTENMMLLVGTHASAYKSYDRKLRAEQMRKTVAEQIGNGTGQININNSGGAVLGPDVEYYQYPNERKLFTRERMFNNYVIEETIPAPKWQITTDTATIGGLPCQKATTRFKGRDYTAWFCADLPYQTGPWKLTGLPGLIVEAADAKKEVIFKFDGIEKVDKSAKAAAGNAPLSTGGRTIMLGGIDDATQNPNLIALPANAIKTTAKELNELREIMRKDPQAFFQSQMAAMQAQMGGAGRSISFGGPGGANVTTGSPTFSVRTNGPSQPVVINNPIELPEKK